MSKVGKASIKLNKDVKVSVSKERVVTAIGPKGELSTKLLPGIDVKISENEINVLLENSEEASPATHGLIRSLINNIVCGVSTGFEKKLEIIGVGYKADLDSKILNLSLGFSHGYSVVLPKEIDAKVEITPTKTHIITLSSIDKQLLGFVAAEIKKLRPVEPYKGKGIRISGEYVRRKAGKSGAKK